MLAKYWWFVWSCEGGHASKHFVFHPLHTYSKIGFVGVQSWHWVLGSSCCIHPYTSPVHIWRKNWFVWMWDHACYGLHPYASPLHVLRKIHPLHSWRKDWCVWMWESDHACYASVFAFMPALYTVEERFTQCSSEGRISLCGSVKVATHAKLLSFYLCTSFLHI